MSVYQEAGTVIHGRPLVLGLSVTFFPEEQETHTFLPQRQRDSCKEGSVILGITDMLKAPSFPTAALASTNEEEDSSVDEEVSGLVLTSPGTTQNTEPPPVLWFLIPGFMWLLACGCGVWFLRHACCARRSPVATGSATTGSSKLPTTAEPCPTFPVPKVRACKLRCTVFCDFLATETVEQGTSCSLCKIRIPWSVFRRKFLKRFIRCPYIVPYLSKE